MARKQGDGLEQHHQMSIPSAVHTQKDQAKDLQLIFTNKVTIRFLLRDNSVETPAGHWCNICK